MNFKIEKCTKDKQRGTLTSAERIPEKKSLVTFYKKSHESEKEYLFGKEIKVTKEFPTEDPTL